MMQLMQSFSTGTELPENSVLITVDDGYRDYLLHAHAAFQEFHIPVTVYLVSDFLDGRCWLWWNEIEYALEHTRLDHAVMPVNGTQYDLPLGTPTEQGKAFYTLCEALKSLPNDGRLAAKQEILRSLDVVLPAELPAKWQSLTWDEVRVLARQNVEFGGHSRTHPILSSLADDAMLRDEIAGCKQRIESELNAPVHHFCYPNGQPQDVGSRVTDVTRESGYRTAVTTEKGMNRLGAVDPFLLQRLAVDADMQTYYLAELLAGFR